MSPRQNEYQKKPKYYSEYQKRWAKPHRKRIRKYHRERHRLMRRTAIALYGSECVCCGEATYEFLAIDHIKGGGTRERRERFPNSQSFYLFVSKNYLPKKYRLLCHNCNSAMGYYGYCPHGRLND